MTYADEFHHAENEQYERIVNYFKPQFLLELTATPERMDSKNIIDRIPFGYTDIIGKVGSNSNEYARVKAVDLLRRESRYRVQGSREQCAEICL